MGETERKGNKGLGGGGGQEVIVEGGNWGNEQVCLIENPEMNFCLLVHRQPGK